MVMPTRKSSRGSQVSESGIRALVILVLVGCVLVAINNGTSYKLTLDLTPCVNDNNPLEATSDHPSQHQRQEQQLTSENKPLLLQMAPTIFPMDPEDPTKIKFPEMVNAVTIDIGARDSDYMQALEESKDKNMSIIMVDPLPESVLPMIARAAKYNMLGVDGPGKDYPHPETGDRAFVIRGAMSETESMQNFNMGVGPSCGSLLKTGKNNTFFCWDTKKQIPVNVFTLQSLLDMIPAHIQTIHIKVDAEGADHWVLRGGGLSLKRAASVIIECKPPPDRPRNKDGPVGSRDGQCNDDEVTKWMCDQRQFCGNKIIPQGGASNIMFWNEQTLGEITIPDFLTKVPIQFRELYKELKHMSDTVKGIATN